MIPVKLVSQSGFCIEQNKVLELKLVHHETSNLVTTIVIVFPFIYFQLSNYLILSLQVRLPPLFLIQKLQYKALPIQAVKTLPLLLACVIIMMIASSMIAL